MKIKDVCLVVKKAIVLQELKGRPDDLTELSRGQVNRDGWTGGCADGAVREKGVLREGVCGHFGPVGDKDLLVLADTPSLPDVVNRLAPLVVPEVPKELPNSSYGM